MTRRPERFVLFVLLVAGSVAAAYFLVTLELTLRGRQAGSHRIQKLTQQARLNLVLVRADQEAYIAEGQDASDWMERVSDDLDRLSTVLDKLSESAPADSTATVDLDAARTAVDAFIVIDNRVREYVEAGNPLPASDLIFEDGMRTAAAIDNHVVAAGDALLAVRLEADSRRRRTMGAILGAWLFGMLTIGFLLLRTTDAPTRDAEAAGTGDAATVEHPPPHGTSSLSKGERRAADPHQPSSSPAFAPWDAHASAAGSAATTTPVTTVTNALPVQQLLPGVDLEIAAAVCTDLAQVKDAEQLAEIVGRAAHLLDASGVIVWTGDDAVSELRPLVIHGYPDDVAGEIPTIPFGADNVTAAAWRAGAARTVRATPTEPGGLAVPLLVATGGVGVLTAEIGHGREQDPATLAVARIIAAQIATLLPTQPTTSDSASGPAHSDPAPEGVEDLFQT
ncbi:MAG: hypothetical protein GEU99_05515 [Luteitalea sp.]|nr:hypothetical protein [Luteitalea sp.]